MASISRDSNGTKRILFIDGNGARRTVRLGAAPVKAAGSFRLRVESLLAANTTGTSLDAETCAWLKGLPERMYARLARVGLVQPRTPVKAVTLDDLLSRFETAAVVKPATKAAYRQTTQSLRAHLGGATTLDAITPARADDWRKAISEDSLAAATVAKRVRVARAIFRKAQRWSLITSSPFADMKAGPQSNPERAFYVSLDIIKKVIEATADTQWRTIIGLSRYAGLRCPSEIVGLT